MLWNILIVLVLFAGAASPADLTLDSKEAAPGTTVTLAIRLAAQDAALTGLQADFEFAGDVMEVTAAVGPAAAEAEKQLIGKVAGTGRYRLMLIGFNRNRIGDGEVALITIQLNADAAGNYLLRLTGVTGTDADGNPISLRSAPATLRVRPGGGS
jgi:hypothetical protein